MKFLEKKTVPLGILNYAFGVFIVFNAMTEIIDVAGTIRYSVIVIATALLALLFLAAYRSPDRILKIKLFSSITMLVIMKMISFSIYESPLFPDDNSLLLIGFVDIYLFVIIILMAGISFILKIPYFYLKTNLSLYRYAGVIFIALSLFLGVAGTLTLRDWFSIL